MHHNCPNCGVTFAREPGFFMGSVYLNYGLTASIVAVVYPIGLFYLGLPQNPLLLASMVFCILFPILIFPFARSFWLGFDEFCDPRPDQPPQRPTEHSDDSDADEQTTRSE
jgi:hypothetical protein